MKQAVPLADLIRGLSTADTLDVIAVCLNQLDTRDAEVEFAVATDRLSGGVLTKHGDVTKDSGGTYTTCYHSEGGAEEASYEYGPSAAAA